MSYQQFKAPLIGVLLLFQMAVSIGGGIIFYGTPAEGEIKLQKSLPVNLDDSKLKLTHNEKSWLLSYRDLDARYDFDEIVKEAQRLNEEAGFFQQRLRNFLASRKGHDLPIFIRIDESKLDLFLNALAAEINKPYINAGVQMLNDQLTVTPGKLGQQLDIEASKTLIKSAVHNLSVEEVALVVRETVPDFTSEVLKEVKESLAIAVTLFNPKDANRVQNINIASKAVDGIIIKPGEEFSFNSQTGPRLQGNGYLEAPVIKNKVLTLDVGGGVCQVATTLYQAVLYTGLQVKERSPHSIPPSYVPLGQDAAVAENTLDFKFVNSLRVPIYINARIDGNKLIIRLFGKKENQYEVKISTEDIREIKPKIKVIEDPALFQGTSKVRVNGQSGFSAKVYRDFVENGKVIKRELINRSYYRPIDTVMVIGTKENSSSQK